MAMNLEPAVCLKWTDIKNEALNFDISKVTAVSYDVIEHKCNKLEQGFKNDSCQVLKV